jgi:hypothetical protein
MVLVYAACKFDFTRGQSVLFTGKPLLIDAIFVDALNVRVAALSVPDQAMPLLASMVLIKIVK